ncbi:LysM peptidoglycan-binding domain-containing protein [Geobacter sp. SVR]|uniref:LysM peptidoglycan-binding domain-containing protein n=1 Tax=Geobacter sp. SVR TaxID=2495594 RepID=UPI00143F045A|nr:LysM peptidoglycan-binding domain-containing protein [Geobacter sp. SVR]BCS53699.1 peptidoglycan-binding protein LysM [Geobacter sp. SVR]GCF85793.1 peptidoglycan-binding protein LysM [Geobacter sp. SVR]
MSRLIALILVGCLLNACSAAPAPNWRNQATALVDDLGGQGASEAFPQEFENLVETFEHGEAVLHVQGDREKADSYYLLALQKGDLLRQELKQRIELQQAEERQRAAEQAARAEQERLSRETEERLRKLERQKAEKGAAPSRAEGQSRDSQALPLSHTVRRGETLPQIAARTEIYNDSSLWPIIYRANRDQIRDPKQLWPGQTLKIPRHFTREEASEARRYSTRK